ncbi:transcription elongation factor [Mesoflavibacter profundi]|uniref:transcription elongation factor n=1 Tax=Mesoflavibacter profundi TaxID=2708110 RepID=UPI002440ADA0
MTIKQQLWQICNNHVEDRINDYKNEINLIKESLESNDKGNNEDDDSGNGKLMNDLEKNIGYLNEARKTHEYLKLVKTNLLSTNAALGSLVVTDTLQFFIAISLGKIEIDNNTYYAISLQSPIGQLLKQKTEGEQFEFNGTKYTIKQII